MASAPAPGLQQLRDLLAEGVPRAQADEDTVRRQWWAALATLQDDFLLPLGPQRGVWLAAPLPALYEPALLQQLQGWVWAPAELGAVLQASAPLLPATGVAAAAAAAGGGFERLPLEDDDGTDPLLVLITPRLQVAMALVGEERARRLVVQFEPAALSAALTRLDERLQRTDVEGVLGRDRCLRGHPHDASHMDARLTLQLGRDLQAGAVRLGRLRLHPEVALAIRRHPSTPTVCHLPSAICRSVREAGFEPAITKV